MQWTQRVGGDLHRGAGLGNRDVRSQAGDDLEIVRAVLAGSIELEQRPQVGDLGIPKALRHHADHRVWLVVERDCRTDDVGTRAEAVLPETVAEDDDLRTAGHVLVLSKGAAEIGPHAQHVEEAGGDVRSGQPLGQSRSREVEAGAEVVVGSGLDEDLARRASASA